MDGIRKYNIALSNPSSERQIPYLLGKTNTIFSIICGSRFEFLDFCIEIRVRAHGVQKIRKEPEARE